jgi:hypothetical protein
MISQVASYPGGLELMMCAGFAIEEREAGEGADEAAKMFLRHGGSADPTKMEYLRYIILRLVVVANCLDYCFLS